jgi:AAA ATPase domain
VTVPTIADVLRRERRSALAGRELELSLLAQIATPRGPLVAYVHGSAGIGKTSLLAALTAELVDKGIQIVRIRTQDIAPCRDELVEALGKELGSDSPAFDDLVAALSPYERIRVVVIDDVDEWQTDLTWLRAELLPSLPANLRFMLGGTTPPSAAWSTEYGQHFLEIKIGCLTREQSDSAVAAASLPARVANRIWTLTRGHPLAAGGDPRVSQRFTR